MPVSDFRCITDSSHIRDVLWPPRCELRGDEIVGGNEVCFELAGGVYDLLNTPLPRSIEIDALNIGKNIDAARVTSESKETVAVGEVFREDVLERCAEIRESGVHCSCIRGIALYEKVDVFRKAGLRVKDNRVAPDNEVFNAMGMEGG